MPRDGTHYNQPLVLIELARPLYLPGAVLPFGVPGRVGNRYWIPANSASGLIFGGDARYVDPVTGDAET